jgi:hypothetical protein
MTTSMPAFTAEEQSVRKKWLTLFKFSVAFAFFPSMLVAVALCFTNPIYLLWYIPLLVIIFFVFHYSLYHCAYKHQGTTVLTIDIIFFIIFAVWSFLAILFLSYGFERPYDIGYLLCMLILDVFWIFPSIKLRKINKKYSKLASEKKCEYLSLEIQKASTLGELDIRRHFAFQTLPSFEARFSEVYAKKRGAGTPLICDDRKVYLKLLAKAKQLFACRMLRVAPARQHIPSVVNAKPALMIAVW